MAAVKPKLAEIFTTWNVLICPSCKKYNWVDAGDPTDYSGMDNELCRCWSCDTIMALAHPDDIFNEDIIDGLETPWKP